MRMPRNAATCMPLRDRERSREVDRDVCRRGIRSRIALKTSRELSGFWPNLGQMSAYRTNHGQNGDRARSRFDVVCRRSARKRSRSRGSGPRLAPPRDAMLQISFVDIYTSEAERMLRARAHADGVLGELLVAQALRASMDGGYE